MSSSQETPARAPAAAARTPGEDNRFHMTEATIEWKDRSRILVEGEVIQLDWLKTVSLAAELFFPDAIYVRKEMCDVFRELTKKNRKWRQILIGSPGVGKSILLFLVALHRVLEEGIKTIFVRKTKDQFELVSVFYMQKKDDTHIQVRYDREVEITVTVRDAVGFILSKYENIHSRPMVLIRNGDFLLYINGLQEGDPDLAHPHHYLSTSGGYDAPQGESARHSSLVVLGGWLKEPLRKALNAMSPDFLCSEETDEIVEEREGNLEDGEEKVDGGIRVEDDDKRTQTPTQTLDVIFYHTGGRIREVFKYAEDPTTWKREKTAMIGRIKKQDALLSIIETKGSGDKDSPDRVRTMFRTGDPGFFGDCLQIVDSQFFAHNLQDRCGLEDYYNAYIHAKKTGLSSAAGCHFEELVHQLFYKRPRPIEDCIQSVGTGAEGVDRLEKYRVYWAPSIPNFANIDAALLLKDHHEEEKEEEWSVTLWCFQYTVSKIHAFNPRTFWTKFLRPVLQSFTLNLEEVTVKVLFIVPHDVVAEFCIPQELEETEWQGSVEFVDCSSVDTLASIFERLDFILSPVEFNSA